MFKAHINVPCSICLICHLHLSDFNQHGSKVLCPAGEAVSFKSEKPKMPQDKEEDFGLAGPYLSEETKASVLAWNELPTTSSVFGRSFPLRFYEKFQVNSLPMSAELKDGSTI